LPRLRFLCGKLRIANLAGKDRHRIFNPNPVRNDWPEASSEGEAIAMAVMGSVTLRFWILDWGFWIENANWSAFTNPKSKMVHAIASPTANPSAWNY
jgi:hypothetical protein